jgi:hypothetical protein
MMARLWLNYAARMSLSVAVLLALAACAHGSTSPPTSGGVPVPTNASLSSSSSVPAPAAQPGAQPLGSAAAVAAAAIPGDDPAIQRWFLAIDKAKWVLNNAYLKAVQGVSRQSATDCQPLGQTVQAIVAALPKVQNLGAAGARIAAAVTPLMTNMGQLASSCTIGDFPTARTILNTVIPQQGNVQATIDSVLDGD